MQRKITMSTMLEALSRFNVTARANIKRDINGGRGQFGTETKRE